MKSEHTFLEMINAAVSHELRNPLNSLIGQVSAMREFFSNFNRVLKEIKEDPEVVKKLKKIQKGLEQCSGKMSSACKFIDFFVHDILDYTLLNKDSNTFMKDNKTFEIPQVIKEIQEILDDKISLKKIKLDIQYRGFNGLFSAKTDRKRLQ